MKRHVMIVLAVAALVRTSRADEIEMPADNVRPPDTHSDTHTTTRAKPHAAQKAAPHALHARPKLAPAKEIAEDDDLPPNLAPAKASSGAGVDDHARVSGAGVDDRARASGAGVDDASTPDSVTATAKQPRVSAGGDDPITDSAATPGVTDVSASVTVPVTRAKWIEPYGAIAGGLRLESLHQLPGSTTGAQNPTVAVSRLGVRGGVGAHVTFASEFEASLGGPLGYGSSVWEGQAAIAIRDQFVRYARDGFAFAAGRIDDPASFDYVSEHVADLLLTDLYTRDPLLYSGADRGNGLWGSYAIDKHFTVGLTFHSTNPTGITGTLIIGGKLQPFDRPFYLAAAQVGNNQNNLPDQNLHIYFGSPSLTFHTDHFDAKSEIQMYSLDTQEAIMDDQTIRGYNLRLGARAWTPLPMGKLAAFANVSRNTNEILDPTTSKYRLPDLFKSYTVSGGVDWDIHNRDGIGFEYAMVDTREPDQHTRDHYINLGATYWLENAVALGLRAAVFAQQLSGEMMTTGSRSLFMTARFVLE